jgi:hypothetical protein
MRKNWVFITQNQRGDFVVWPISTNIGADGQGFATFVEAKLVEDHSSLEIDEAAPRLVGRYGNTWLFVMSPKLGEYMTHHLGVEFSRWARKFRKEAKKAPDASKQSMP